jgi:hypothetical protein
MYKVFYSYNYNVVDVSSIAGKFSSIAGNFPAMLETSTTLETSTIDVDDRRQSSTSSIHQHRWKIQRAP